MGLLERQLKRSELYVHRQACLKLRFLFIIYYLLFYFQIETLPAAENADDHWLILSPPCRLTSINDLNRPAFCHKELIGFNHLLDHREATTLAFGSFESVARFSTATRAYITADGSLVSKEQHQDFVGHSRVSFERESANKNFRLSFGKMPPKFGIAYWPFPDGLRMLKPKTFWYGNYPSLAAQIIKERYDLEMGLASVDPYSLPIACLRLGYNDATLGGSRTFFSLLGQEKTTGAGFGIFSRSAKGDSLQIEVIKISTKIDTLSTFKPTQVSRIAYETFIDEGFNSIISYEDYADYYNQFILAMYQTLSKDLRLSLSMIYQNQRMPEKPYRWTFSFGVYETL